MCNGIPQVQIFCQPDINIYDKIFKQITHI